MSEQGPAANMRTTDPAKMRALAHPIRVAILQLLGDHDELTASEVAELLDQTVANCSFHLRTLARHGFIERGAPRGREKPWRAVHRSHDFTPDPGDPVSVAQSASLASVFTEREAERLQRTFDRVAVDPPDREWATAMTVLTGDFWATAEEMTELVQAVNALLGRFEGRGADPSLRPAGARHGHLFAAVNPDPDSLPHDPDAAAAAPTHA